jgi:Ca2+-binding RTX toxin-like protein
LEFIGGRRAIYATADNLTIENSTFANQFRDAIFINAVSGTTTITGNTFSGDVSSKKAILFENFSSEDPTVSGTILIADNTLTGKGNFVVYNQWQYDAGPAVAHVDLTVTGNDVSGTFGTPISIYDPRQDDPAFDVARFDKFGVLDITDNTATLSTGTILELPAGIAFSGSVDLDGNTIEGTEGADDLSGTPGHDTILGNGGNDTIHHTVGDGVDTIDGGAGTDTLAVSGTAGNDTIHVAVNGSGVITSIDGLSPTNVEQYTLDGVGGTDTLDYTGTTGGVTVNLGTNSATGFTSVTGVENVVGGGGNDALTGDAGANMLTGGGGNDTLAGGAGSDTVVYTGTITAAMIADDGLGHFVVATGGAQGTDTLSGVEKVIDGAGHNFLFVGNGGYATIQAAVDAAASGDTILIAAGTYREQVSVSGKDISLQGAGIGQTIIESPDAADLAVSATDSNSGRPTKYAVVTVTNDSNVTITGVTVDGRDQGGFRLPPPTTTSSPSTCSIPMPISTASRSPAPTSWPAPTSPASSATTPSSPPATTSPTAATVRTPSRSRIRPSAASRRTASSSTARR